MLESSPSILFVITPLLQTPSNAIANSIPGPHDATSANHVRSSPANALGSSSRLCTIR